MIKQLPPSPLAHYWSLYGGAGAVVRSKYFWLAIVLTVLSWGRWSAEGWWADVTSVSPSLLGFSIAAFTLFTGSGNEEFRRSLMESEEPTSSVFVQASANFLHFILIQAMALIVALVLQALNSAPMPPFLCVIPHLHQVNEWARLFFYFIGYLIFLYGCLLAIASTMAVFRMARMQNVFHHASKENQKK